MSAKSAPSRLGLKLLIIVVAVVAAVFVAIVVSRPVAMVQPVTSNVAVDAKAGSVTVVAEYGMELKSEFGGRVLAKDFKLDPGAQVKAGDVLAQLDPAELQIAIEKDENDFAVTKERFTKDHSTELKLESAHADLDNFRRQNKLGGYPDIELAKREREVKMMEQQAELEKIDHKQTLANFDNLLKSEHLKLAHMTITAPFNGVVSAVNVHPGDLLGGGSPVATLITTNKVVEGQISEEEFAKVRIGQKASVTFIPYGSMLFPASVVKILPTADPQTQRHLVHLNVAVDDAHPLVPGTNGEMSIVVDQHPARAIVPRRALFTHGGDSVWVVKGGRVEERRVKKGFVWATGAEIVEGLEPGELVIVDQLEAFHDGQRVRMNTLQSDAVPGGR